MGTPSCPPWHQSNQILATPIGIGTPRRNTVALLERAVDLGVDHIDTAQFYGNGFVNEAISELLGSRDGIIVASKVGADLSPNEKMPLKEVAERLKITPSQLGLTWLLADAPDMLLIPGTADRQHLEENVVAASIRSRRKLSRSLMPSTCRPRRMTSSSDCDGQSGLADRGLGIGPTGCDCRIALTARGAIDATVPAGARPIGTMSSTRPRSNRWRCRSQRGWISRNHNVISKT